MVPCPQRCALTVFHPQASSAAHLLPLQPLVPVTSAEDKHQAMHALSRDSGHSGGCGQQGALLASLSCHLSFFSEAVTHLLLIKHSENYVELFQTFRKL